MPASGFPTAIRPAPMCIPMGFHMGACARNPYLKGEFLYFITLLSAWFPCSAYRFLWRKWEWSSLHPQIGGLDVFTVDGMQVACWYFPSMIAHCYLPLIVHLSEAGKKIKCFCFWISKIFVTLHLWKVAGRSWGHGTEEHVAWVWHRRQHRWNKKNICNGIYVKGRLRQTRIRT